MKIEKMINKHKLNVLCGGQTHIGTTGSCHVFDGTACTWDLVNMIKQNISLQKSDCKHGDISRSQPLINTQALVF